MRERERNGRALESHSYRREGDVKVEVRNKWCNAGERRDLEKETEKAKGGQR